MVTDKESVRKVTEDDAINAEEEKEGEKAMKKLLLWKDEQLSALPNPDPRPALLQSTSLGRISRMTEKILEDAMVTRKLTC